MDSDQEDRLFRYTVEDVNQTGGRSELPLQKQSKKQDKEVRDNTTLIREAHVVQIVPKSQETSLGKGQVPHKRRQFNSAQREKRSLVKFDGGYFLEENKSDKNSCFVGLGSFTMFKEYPHKRGVALFYRGVCSKQRIKLIGNGGVVVYVAAQDEGSELSPIVQCFRGNIEEKVPKELVKFEREE